MLESLPELNLDDWRQLPPADTVLLVVNARLGRALQRDWLAGQHACPAPRLYLAADWLQAAVQPLWGRGLLAPGRLLGSFEEAWVWQSLVERSEAGQHLLDAYDAARLAMEAHAIQVEWPQPVGDSEHTQEYQLYLQWQQEFRQHCQHERLLDGARWQDWLRQQILAHSECWPRHLLLAGFDELSPAWSQFLQTLASRGVQLARLQRPAAPPQRQQRAYADSDSELRAAVQWAQERIDAGQRVALVLPDLAQRRAHVLRVLDSVLHPECLDPAQWERPRRYNISLGEPLASQPPVTAALAALRLLLQGRGWELPDAAPWLLSPFLHATDDALQQASREAGWRRHGTSRLSWQQMQQQDWAQPWCNARQGLQGISRGRPSRWASQFAHALQQLDWPGSRQLSSHEYQALTAWQDALHDWALFDECCGELTAAQALQLLNRFMQERVFQVQSSANAPLQILGLLETAGARFDAVWLLSMTDACLPQRPRPNALLPARWQRRHDTPHSSARRESRFARQLLADLERCTPELIASHPQFDGETELRISPLLLDWPAGISEDCPPAERPPALFEQIDDSRGLPLPEGRRIRGGARVLELQAILPLWAYAECRLGAQALESWRIYPDARLRGTLTHAALEACWDSLQQQSALLALTPEHEFEHIRRSVSSARSSLAEQLRECGAHWLQLEQHRQERLLQRWLALEKQRPHAFHILAQEQEHVWQHGPLQLTLRMDRIDQLPQGLLLIDYKTGACSVAGWGDPQREDRPLRAVQLPLYAVAISARQPVIGTAFACLAPKPRDFGFRARLQIPDLLEASRKPLSEDDYETCASDWQARLQFWQEHIDALAADFAAGIATHKQCSPAELRWCTVLPFLRPQPTDVPEADDVNEEDHAQPTL